MAVKKVAVVTGGGTGIGAASALTLLKNNWNVVISGRRHDLLESILSSNPEEAKSLKAIPADVTKEDDVRNLFSSTVSFFGRVDLLFNNAGASLPATEIDQVTLEDWNRIIDVNLTGMFLCAREAFKNMKSQNPIGGRIINNGSIAAYAPRPKSAPYTASKHAVSGLTKSIQLDGRAYKIACSQIDIGNADTEIGNSVSKGALQADGSVKTEPLLDVNHVAEAILYMANLPLDANVANMTLLATNMPFVGRG